MWQDSLASEGWALYAEALLAEPQGTAKNGFYTPEEHLYQLRGKLYRDLRVRIDTGIHTGRLSFDDAVTLFSEVVDFLPGSCSGRQGAEERRQARKLRIRACCGDALFALAHAGDHLPIGQRADPGTKEASAGCARRKILRQALSPRVHEAGEHSRRLLRRGTVAHARKPAPP